MGAAQIEPGSRLAGREAEQRLLAEAFWRASAGQPCAVVVHGEAGVGKTRLVRDACDRQQPRPEVLWGTCVHFGEASVPFAPLIGALQAWRAQAADATSGEVLSGIGELGVLLPALGEARTPEPGRLVPLIDAVVSRIADRGLTVLVVDDLQWADRTSLDVLAYLVTGLRGQRLVLLATCRDEHRGEGHPLHGWLADMRRMPGFTEIHLDRLAPADTQAQIEGLLAQAVDVGFVAQVQERSDGNPYLTELLVRGLSGTEPQLPATAPAELRDALLASWHSLSAAARQVTRVLAIGGRPIELPVLAEVLGQHGVAPTLLARCLTEAQDHGVVHPDGAGRPWFRHPLLAEVLYGTVAHDEAVKIHTAYVRALESLVVEVPDSVATDLAVHNDRARRVDEAFRWSMIAADRAAALHATTEESIHLERACSLWDKASPNARGTSTGRVDLLRRASGSCHRAGRSDVAARLVRLALTLVDRSREPLLTSTLLLALSGVTHAQSALGKTVVGEHLDAVRLTEAFPDSAEHAHALAALGFAEAWDGLHDEASLHANDAVEAARRSGSNEALAHALNTRAFVHIEDFAANPLADAEEAVRVARSCRTTDLLIDATIWQANCLITLGRSAEATELAHAAFEEVVREGREFAYFLAGIAADGLLQLGRWNDCRDLLRTALAARCGGIAGASIRQTAAQLAARCGRVAEAKLHLERARELVSEEYAGLHGSLTNAGAEVFLAAHEPQKALEWHHNRILIPPAANPRYGEDDLVPFAHTAAEAAQAARDAGDDRGVARAVALLEDVVDRLPAEPFTTPRPDREDQAMLKAVFDAEVARCRGEPNQAELWRKAIEKCHAAGRPWEGAVASLRCAEALLAAGSPASAVSGLLRQSHLTAAELGAWPLQTEVETLARIARISLRQPTPVENTLPAPAALASLTAREREILAFLMAGRSNSEIAKALVISNKTVSVHVSNILRKTGTTTRVEAAALAERLATSRDT